MACVLNVHYDDAEREAEQFGVPDGFTIPSLIDHMDWLILPATTGQDAKQIVIRLRDVAWMSVVDKQT
jgi:hypothetical protein